MKLDRILCPVDFSETSTAALQTAGRLAKTLNAELTVLHAQRWEYPVYFTLSQTRTLQAHLRKSERAARRYFEGFVKRNLPVELYRKVAFVEEDPVTAILRLSRKLGADLIVMGTHGRKGWSRFRLGSVLEDVLRQAEIPVLAVGPGVQSKGLEAGIAAILCPVNFSAPSRTTLELAAYLAGRTSASLTVLHVVEAGSKPDVSVITMRNQLCDWVKSEAEGQCVTEEIVRRGSVVEAIAHEAEKIRSDLLVIGARSRQSLGAIMFGTTTEALIRSAPCPVLVVGERRVGGKPVRTGETIQRK